MEEPENRLGSIIKRSRIRRGGESNLFKEGELASINGKGGHRIRKEVKKKPIKQIDGRKETKSWVYWKKKGEGAP